MIRFIVTLVLVAGSSAPGEATAAAARARLFEAFLENGDLGALSSLTYEMNVDEISEHLKAMPQRMSVWGQGQLKCVVTHEISYDSVCRMAVDSQGDLHVVFTKQRVTKDRKNGIEYPECALFYTRWVDDQWQKPTAMPDCKLFPERLLLVLDADDTKWLFGAGRALKETPLGGGDLLRNILAMRCSKEGSWSESKCVIEDEPHFIHGLDVLPDAAGSMHLAWSHYFRESAAQEHIRYVQLGDGGGDMEELRPPRHDDMAYPRLASMNGAVHLFAFKHRSYVGGQELGARGLEEIYHYVREGERWRQLPNVTDQIGGFDWKVSVSGDNLLMAVPANHEAAKKAYAVYRSTDEGDISLRTHFCLPGRYTEERWSVSSMEDGSNGALYSIIARMGAVYLIRIGAQGRVEAICLNHSGSERWEIREPQFLISGGEFHAVWTAKRHARSSVMHIGGRLPEDGWVELCSLTWRATCSTGLGKTELCELDGHLCAEAQEIEASGDTVRAIERYIYVIANRGRAGYGGSYGLSHLPYNRLFEMDCSGIQEVSDQVYRYAIKHSGEENYSFDGLLRLLDIDPAVPPQRVAPQPSEEDDIYEVVFRHLIDRNLGGDREPEKIFLTVDRNERDEAFYKRFKDYSMPVSAPPHPGYEGLRINISAIRWETKGRVKVWCGSSFNHPEASAGYSFMVERKNGLWEVTGMRLESVV